MTKPNTYGTITASTNTATSPAASSTSCPVNLSGTWEYPHFIIPVSKSNPAKAYGTSYNGTLTTDISTTFTFDLPTSYEGKTCSLIFLLPQLSQLETSSYSLSGNGSLDIYELGSAVDPSVTYSSLPTGTKIGSVPCVEAGNSWLISSHTCAAGSRISFEFVVASGDLALVYFQDYNPSPIGAYISVC